MKKYFSLFIILSCITFFLGCTWSISKKNIEGKWRIDNLEIDIPILREEIIQDAKEEIINDVYHFKEDGSFTYFSHIIKMEYPGQWKFNNITHQLTLISNAEYPDTTTYYVRKQYTSQLKLILGLGDLGSETLTLTKVR